MGRLNAAVIIPPVEDFYYSPRRFASLGALKTAEILEKAGGKAEIFNFTDSRGVPARKPDYLDYLDKIMLPGETGLCSYFTAFKRFGPEEKKCAEIIAESGCDTAFFSLFAYCYAEPAVRLAVRLKQLKPGIRLAAGGAGVSVFPGYFRQYFDDVLPGEAEVCIDKFLRSSCMEEAASSSVGNKDFTLSAAVAESGKKSIHVSAVLTRGCGKNCRFCANYLTHGRIFRKSSLNHLKDKLGEMKNTLMPHAGKKVFINFEDDNLLNDPDYFLNAVHMFRSFFEKLFNYEKNSKKILFSAENGLDYSLLTEKTAACLIKSGFRQFNFTLASSDNCVLQAENRDSDTEKLEKTVLYLEKKGIPSVCYFIAGLGNDTPEKCTESLLFLNSLPAVSGISMFYAVPGLPGFDNFDQLLTIPPGLFRGSSAWPWNNTLSTQQLVTAFRLSRITNLFKNKNLSPSDRKLAEVIKNKKQIITQVKKEGKVYEEKPPEIDKEMESLFFRKAAL